MHYMDADKAYREKARLELHKNATSYIEQILEAARHDDDDDDDVIIPDPGVDYYLRPWHKCD